MQRVVALTAIQIILAIHVRIPREGGLHEIISAQKIVPAPAQQDIIAGESGQSIIAIPSIQEIISCRSIEPDPTAGDPLASQAIVPITAENHIIARSAGEHIVALTPIEIIRIIAERVIAKDAVVPLASGQMIFAEASLKLVVPDTPVQFVIALVGDEQVIPILAEQPIAAERCHQGIVPLPAEHNLIMIAFDRDLIIATQRIDNKRWAGLADDVENFSVCQIVVAHRHTGKGLGEVDLPHRRRGGIGRLG